MNNDLINELYSKIDNQEKIIVDLQKNNSGITLEEHVRVLNAYQELQEKYNKQKEVIDRAIELLNNPWSFESGNKEVDEITYNKKRKVIDILKGSDSNEI